jgi:hypothetical protein
MPTPAHIRAVLATLLRVSRVLVLVVLVWVWVLVVLLVLA